MNIFELGASWVIVWSLEEDVSKNTGLEHRKRRRMIFSRLVRFGKHQGRLSDFDEDRASSGEPSHGETYSGSKSETKILTR